MVLLEAAAREHGGVLAQWSNARSLIGTCKYSRRRKLGVLRRMSLQCEAIMVCELRGHEAWLEHEMRLIERECHGKWGRRWHVGCLAS